MLFIGPIRVVVVVVVVHNVWTSILHCHSPGVATIARRLCYSYSWLQLILVVVSTVTTPGEWQCKITTGGVRRLAVANRPNIFQMLLVEPYKHVLYFPPKIYVFNNHVIGFSAGRLVGNEIVVETRHLIGMCYTTPLTLLRTSRLSGSYE